MSDVSKLILLWLHYSSKSSADDLLKLIYVIICIINLSFQIYTYLRKRLFRFFYNDNQSNVK